MMILNTFAIMAIQEGASTNRVWDMFSPNLKTRVRGPIKPISEVLRGDLSVRRGGFVWFKVPLAYSPLGLPKGSSNEVESYVPAGGMLSTNSSEYVFYVINGIIKVRKARSVDHKDPIAMQKAIEQIPYSVRHNSRVPLINPVDYCE